MLTKETISKTTLSKAFYLMATAKAMNDTYEKNFKKVSKYVHATSRGHEAIQIACGLLLKPQDFASLYYRDDAFLLAIGMSPYDLMLQLLAKKDDPFSGGRMYYGHPSLKDEDKPKIPFQSSATGMQAIPTTGIGLGLKYQEGRKISSYKGKDKPVVVCSLGDASVTEGEVAEAFQMAALHQLPMLYLVQDNGWDISATAEETRAMNAYEYAQGFPGIEAISIDGSDFLDCYQTLKYVVDTIRKERRPFLVHAKVPLLTHHTSGVRMEWYRHDLAEHLLRDPYPLLKALTIESGISENKIQKLEKQALKSVESDLIRALSADFPSSSDLYTHDFAPTPVTEETGDRKPANGEEKVMVDCALYAIKEIMEDHPECLFYGQDVGERLGGVFREAALLAKKFGNDRVFNTAIQEAFIVGSTVGMSAVGLKPIVEVQFADYIWPGLNQLFTEVSRSCYLSNGKWPVSMVLRVPIGAYGNGGPFHSSSVESVVCNIKGLKIVYPSNGADLKGLMKAAYDDPNPVVIFEHKGLYWSKVKGTEMAKTVMPGKNYTVPIGKAKILLALPEKIDTNESCLSIISYGMGVHWAFHAAKKFQKRIEIVDLRSLYPLDTEMIFNSIMKTGRALVVTEEPVDSSFAQSVAARIQENCFQYLDAPVKTFGAKNLPAIPLSENLEKEMMPSIEKLGKVMEDLLLY
jgi:2-oxoisovalerate dehydrogenase E1 component